MHALPLPSRPSLSPTPPLQVAVFQEYLPLISAICNPGLRERHWAQMAEVVGFEIKRDEVTSLKRLIDCDIVGHLSKVRGERGGSERK